MAAANQLLPDQAGRPLGDARHLRPDGVGNGLGLPVQGRDRPKKIVHRIRLATLNIGTLTGRSRELADTLKTRRIDIACIQETKWKGSKARDIGEGYKLIYHGVKSSQNGVAVAICQQLRDSVSEVDNISDRLISIKIISGPTILRVVSCYAPQVGCTDQEKDEFWESLGTHLQMVAPDEHVLVGGDLNGHVGIERKGYEQVHGGQGLGIRNDEGSRILDCAEAHDLVVVNTFFRKRPSHLATYISGGHTTQIDYWMIRRCDLKLALDAKVIPSDTIGPQHRPLVLDLQLNLHRQTRMRVTGPEHFKWWRLPEHKQQLKVALQSLNINLDQPVDRLWNDITCHIQAAASDILGSTKPGRQYMDKQVWWWGEEVQIAIKAKKQAYKLWHRTRLDAHRQNYRTHKSAAKRVVAKAKAEYYHDLYEQLGTPEGEKMIYRIANSRHKSTQAIGQVKHIKSAEGLVLRDPPPYLLVGAVFYHHLK
ncbi:craniofacial development protein 2-like [Onychostoma macrolepis]|uniref:craniofacial development protein 2-like n=1 Tax=Onychostoma macrolepis TaxID=369639 RepID=UPI00272B2B16|nr:craniofacial development protein 2-like [Onychostoma macrolepis]